METPSPSSLRFRFSGFEVNPRTGELVRDGQHAQLQEKSLQLLLALLERPGELLSREELAGKLWPAGTFVDFERGLHKTVHKLREVLGDSADHPQFIETLPRKGYRFIGTLEKDGPSEEAQPIEIPVPEPRRRKWRYALGVGVGLAALGIVAATNFMGWRDAIVDRLSPSPVQIASLMQQSAEGFKKDGALVEAARCYAQIGQKDQALALLEKCYEQHCSSIVTLKAEPDFDVLRTEGRFQNLLQQLGLDQH